MKTSTLKPKSSRRYFRWLFRCIVLFVLLASLGFNVISWNELKREYTEMKTVRLDPLGTRDANFPADTPATAPSDAPLLLFFGDSRARAWPAPQASGWRFANRGIDGQTTEQAIGRFADEVAALKPKVIVIECGVNDLTAIGVLPAKRETIVSACKENLRRMIAIGRDNGATVIVATIFPTGPVSLGRRPFWSDQIDVAIKAVNADIRMNREPNVKILDADEVLRERGVVRKGSYLDTLHLKREGYDRLNAALVRLLNSQ